MKTAGRDSEAEVLRADVVIVGSGVAGLSTALSCSGMKVHLLTKGTLDSGSSSLWAQGGIAAAVGSDDSPSLHSRDTLSAGAELCREEIVELLTREGPQLVERLIQIGTRFDRDASGQLQLGREAAHSRNRVLHAHGDATGAEIVRALVQAVLKTPLVGIFPECFAGRLVQHSGRVSGLVSRDSKGRTLIHLAPAVVIATGGVGHLFRRTTNPRQATGDGICMAARAGAELSDLEFVQFHPTALDAGLDPMPLLTEALRGEGATLVDERGRRFMRSRHRLAELAPRDIVARAIWEQMRSGRRVFLDARRSVGERFERRFPTVFQSCLRSGIDPRREKIPVSPAAHYNIGGVAVDVNGRSSLAGLWACGEAAASGVHGANRLASNSLLEGLVFGRRVGQDIGSCTPSRLIAAADAGDGPPICTPWESGPEDRARRESLRDLMWNRVGLVREESELKQALDTIAGWLEVRPRELSETRNLLSLGLMICSAALARRESRGVHFRSDFPTSHPGWRQHLMLKTGPTGRRVELQIPCLQGQEVLP